MIDTDPRGRRCSACGKKKALNQFAPIEGLREGRAPWCLACAKLAKRASDERLSSLARFPW